MLQKWQILRYTCGIDRESSLFGSKRTEYVHNGRGSVASEVTKNQAWYTLGGLLSGKDVSSKAYTPFGEQIGEASSGFGYNGEYYNAATGQVYLRARFYEPELNRFSQKDIVRGEVTRPQRLNRYLYVENDPISYVDSNGEFLGSALKKVGSAIKKVAAPVVKKATAAVSKKTSAVKKAVTTVKAAANTAKKVVNTVKTVVQNNRTTKSTSPQNAKLARMEKQLTPATVKKPIPPKQRTVTTKTSNTPTPSRNGIPPSPSSPTVKATENPLPCERSAKNERSKGIIAWAKETYDDVKRWGQNAWESAREGIEDVRDSAIKRKNEVANNSGTFSLGLNVYLGAGIGGGFGVSIAADNRGNIGLVSTYPVGATTPNASMLASASVTNASDIYKLGGQFGSTLSIGGSTILPIPNAPPVITAGYDYSMISDPEKETNTAVGHTANVGLSVKSPVPFEAHAYFSKGDVVGFNVYDTTVAVCNWILGE